MRDTLDPSLSQSQAAPKLLVSTAEMANLISVSTRHLLTLRNEGMPHIRRGQLVLFDPTECVSWLKNRYGARN